ncbi:MAG: ABC transporter permease [Saprospiraceae bacterium]|nr:ABC transporter permease [Candidatus Opimibacter skivensis]MBP8087078.1 ABC transporter permease [Saprospiraceae bacterium]
MRESWIIARKELNSFFDSLVAYILLIAFLGFSGFFTWLWGSDIFYHKQASLNTFFNVALWSLFFFIPAITMRQFAEEKKSGTIELLLTKRLTDRQLVIGKFLACILLVAIALAFTLPYYVSIARLGNIDHGSTITGYLGLLLMSSAYVSIGLLASSLTNNQIVAFLMALLAGVVFQFILGSVGSGQTGWIGSLLMDLSIPHHYDSMSRGVIDTKDVLYFLALTFLGLMLTEVVISKRK